MVKNAVTVLGAYNLHDESADAVEVETALENLDYDANAKFVVVGPNSKNQFWIFRIVSA